ncbi:MAG: hypothetical protein VW642_11705 [Halieaceae bacterium]|jgi:hypothetical protein
MKLNISNVLIFAFLCSLSLAPTASAQFGMDKLLGGDKEEEETAEQADSPSSALGGLFGGGKEEEPEFVLADAATWLAKSKEEQVQYISEVRELYPEDPPIGSPEAAALAEEREEKEGGLGFLKKAGRVLGGGQEVDEGELVRGMNDDQLKVYLALGAQDRVKYALNNQQELMVTLFRDALIEVNLGQVKVLRAFDREDEAASLEAAISTLSGECDNACLEGTVEQSESVTTLIDELAESEAEMTELGKEQYNGAMKNLGSGTLNLGLLIPVALEWGPRALNAIAEETAGGISNAFDAGMASAATEMEAQGKSETEQAALREEQAALQAEADAVAEAMAGNIEEMFAPGILVATRGPSLLKNYGGLIANLTGYGKKNDLDTSDLDDFDFGDI